MTEIAFNAELLIFLHVGQDWNKSSNTWLGDREIIGGMVGNRLNWQA
ncbi:hypothetical protein [Aeromonas salmonicida]